MLHLMTFFHYIQIIMREYIRIKYIDIYILMFILSESFFIFYIS
jgi:hypothetical protein